MRDVGRRIAELRRERGWTQASFAERMGVSWKYVQRLEAGSENLSLASIVEIANVLGARARALFVKPKGTPVRRPGRPSR